MLFVGLGCAAGMLAVSVISIAYVAVTHKQRGVALAASIALLALNAIGFAAVVASVQSLWS